MCGRGSLRKTDKVYTPSRILMVSDRDIESVHVDELLYEVCSRGFLGVVYTRLARLVLSKCIHMPL